ncbi:MAG: large subunit ribosomal protein L9 [Candidatus Peregrinibacteria bacterium Greene0416_19]|nr:MAG: large subunit ribosomal protein L9 [Candidatus Peregrinibacteria bacterium Greene0416_19]
MEILLLEDINGIGKKNDLLIVGDGFALNFLLPQRKALVATPTVRKRYAEQIRRRAEEKEREKQTQQQAAQALAGKSITFIRKATKAGKLYGAISEENIAAALAEQLQITFPAGDVQIADPIKAVGSFKVTLAVGAQTYPLTVNVKAEGK